MTIELLYFDGCPNWEAVLHELNEVIAERGLDEIVKLIEVPDEEAAQQLHFLGSPTVRIDGKDIDASNTASVYTMACRIYWVNGKAQGAPPRAWLEAAIQGSQR